MAAQMIALIEDARKAGDSLGGVVEAVARGVPAGWGEPVFDRLEADLAQGDAVAAGVEGLRDRQRLRGHAPARAASTTIRSTAADGRVRTRTNRSGGVQGGISNGETIVLRVAFKPTATILREQETVDVDGQRDDDQGARPPRSVRAAARRADRRGHDGARARRPLPAPARTVRVEAPARALARAARPPRRRSGVGCRERAERFIGVDAAPPPAAARAPPRTRARCTYSFTGPTSVTFSWHGTGRTVRVWSKDAAPREIEAHEREPEAVLGARPLEGGDGHRPCSRASSTATRSGGRAFPCRRSSARRRRAARRASASSPSRAWARPSTSPRSGRCTGSSRSRSRRSSSASAI